MIFKYDVRNFFKSMEENNNSKNKNLDSLLSEGPFKYKDGEKQSVLKIFGIELTAPSGLKNPGVVYISFIVVNFILFSFLILKSFVTPS